MSAILTFLDSRDIHNYFIRLPLRLFFLIIKNVFNEYESFGVLSGHKHILFLFLSDASLHGFLRTLFGWKHFRRILIGVRVII